MWEDKPALQEEKPQNAASTNRYQATEDAHRNVQGKRKHWGWKGQKCTDPVLTIQVRTLWWSLTKDLYRQSDLFLNTLSDPWGGCVLQRTDIKEKNNCPLNNITPAMCLITRKVQPWNHYNCLMQKKVSANLFVSSQTSKENSQRTFYFDCFSCLFS